MGKGVIMYQVGQQVVYGMHGVCNVIDMEQKTIDRRNVTYMVLEPLGQSGSRYLVPTHNQAAMAKVRRMLTREELEALIASQEVLTDSWIRDENLRKQAYRELIGSGDRVRLMQMVRSLYHHKREQAEAGKKFHLCDENFLRDAERLLTGEFSIVLNMEPEQVKQYLRNRLKEDA